MTGPYSIELTLQSIQGIIWNPDKYASDEDLSSRIKACVAFSGSAPNMKVSSFTMCPRSGNLVVESNGLECDESKPSKTRSMMCATFEDPLEAKHARLRLSSSQSASSGTSYSTYRPHLQFEMSKNSSTMGKDSEYQQPSNGSRCGAGSIELHVTLRSDEPYANTFSVEGMATLHVPAKFETLPITLDLSITPAMQTAICTEESSTRMAETHNDVIRFDSNAAIRVVLCQAPHRPREGLSTGPSSSKADLVLSDNLDEIQLGGIMRQMHEKEEIEDARIRAAAKLLNMRHRPENAAEHRQRQRRYWILCNGSSELGLSFQTFFDVLKGCSGHRRNLKSKLDPDQDLFLASTMASTIDTRDSLEI
jgi:hypothetical protein